MKYTLEEVQQVVCDEVSRDLGDRDPLVLDHIAEVGLVEEVGEVMGLVKRSLRDYPKDRERATREHFIEEMGDVLWYFAMLCNRYDMTMDEVWEYNRHKLEERYGK